MPPNKFKNDVTFHFLGKERTLRPSFSAIAAIETKTDRSIYAIARSCGDKKIGVRLSDVAAVLWAGINAGEPSAQVEFEEVGEEVHRVGLTAVMQPFVQFIVAAVSDGKPRVAASDGASDPPAAKEGAS